MIEVIDSALSIVNKLLKAHKSSQDATLQRELLPLLDTLVQVKAQFVEEQKKNLELERQLRDAQERLRLRANVVFREGCYHLKEPVGGLSTGPFCLTCYEAEDRLITLAHPRVVDFASRRYRIASHYRCPRCKRDVYPPSAP